MAEQTTATVPNDEFIRFIRDLDDEVQYVFIAEDHRFTIQNFMAANLERLKVLNEKNFSAFCTETRSDSDWIEDWPRRRKKHDPRTPGISGLDMYYHYRQFMKRLGLQYIAVDSEVFFNEMTAIFRGEKMMDPKLGYMPPDYVPDPQALERCFDLVSEHGRAYVKKTYPLWAEFYETASISELVKVIREENVQFMEYLKRDRSPTEAQTLIRSIAVMHNRIHRLTPFFRVSNAQESSVADYIYEKTKGRRTFVTGGFAHIAFLAGVHDQLAKHLAAENPDVSPWRRIRTVISGSSQVRSEIVKRMMLIPALNPNLIYHEQDTNILMPMSHVLAQEKKLRRSAPLVRP